jgi:glyceraldehyde 3-phosphate dehydrogenase
MARIAINGFGRIGRCVTRVIFEAKKQGLDRRDQRPHRREHAGAPAQVRLRAPHRGRFSVDRGGPHRRRQAHPDLRQEGSGRAPVEGPRRRRGAGVHGQVHRQGGLRKHLAAGAKRVLLSAPPGEKDTDGSRSAGSTTRATTRPSTSSCRTRRARRTASRRWRRSSTRPSASCKGHMTTVHSVHQRPEHPRPAAQGPAPRPRRGDVDDPDDHGRRPAMGLVLPELKGKLDGTSIRVPTPDVSITVLTAVVEADLEGRGQRRLTAAANGALQGVLGFQGAPRLVGLHRQPARVRSSTPRSRRWSAGTSSRSWYDNEWGFSHAWST